MVTPVLNRADKKFVAAPRDNLQAVMQFPAAGLAPPVCMPHCRRAWLKSWFNPEWSMQAPPIGTALRKLLALSAVAFLACCDAAADAMQTSSVRQQRRPDMALGGCCRELEWL
eukprot:CAMPEP_0203864070 /NCGR_PEP_ID=MMETSP0359-20131031/14544_1 /ASSEMBLY_ACC=CAM_ASM_000338 /TAXON_ID=268821 /ORGANISM="Scrippsiella Hangoei, Strain SHTV-5" /LENGTH=112 /DNA_ID=CAMNT_0050781735 /DNA_START=362 /DNA_END=697 /DNA_ORIENTATION=-